MARAAFSNANCECVLFRDPVLNPLPSVTGGCGLIFLLSILLSISAWGKPDYLKPISEEGRLKLLSQATLWEPFNIEQADIMKGPDSPIWQPHNGVIDCDFEKPGKLAYNGNSLKFKCKFGQKSLKVKYLRDEEQNREVFSETASTRFFQALGFYADTVFPVQTNCKDCPEDPFEGKGPPALRNYPYTIIEDKLDGTEVQVTLNQGWTFEELELTAGTYGEQLTERQKQVEALKLLAVFVQHADRKPEQQRLVCTDVDLTKVDVKKDGTDEYYQEKQEGACLKPKMLIQDLGATWGGFTGFSMTVAAKMSFEHWKARPIFDEKLYKKTFDAKRGSGVCRGDMRISRKAGGEKGRPDPLIRDEGRELLGDLLKRFRDAGKAEELFKTANVDALAKEGSSVQAWTEVFNRKVDEILNHKCCIPDAEGKRCIK